MLWFGAVAAEKSGENLGRICKRRGEEQGAGAGRMPAGRSWPSETRTVTRIDDVADDRTAAGDRFVPSWRGRTPESGDGVGGER